MPLYEYGGVIGSGDGQEALFRTSDAGPCQRPTKGGRRRRSQIGYYTVLGAKRLGLPILPTRRKALIMGHAHAQTSVEINPDKLSRKVAGQGVVLPLPSERYRILGFTDLPFPLLPDLAVRQQTTTSLECTGAYSNLQ